MHLSVSSQFDLDSLIGIPTMSALSTSPDVSRSTSPFTFQFPRSRFFFEDVMAEFLVEDCLFRVHRYYLDRESAIFPHKSQREDGIIELEGVTRMEFENLLEYFYGRREQEPSLEAWISVLSISTRFDMSFIRSKAIAAIAATTPPIDPVDQVILAEMHNVPEWLPVAYTVLCSRDKPLTVREGERLGAKTTVKIAEARERLRDEKLRELGAEIEGGDVRCTVMDVFWPREPAQKLGAIEDPLLRFFHQPATQGPAFQFASPVFESDGIAPPPHPQCPRSPKQPGSSDEMSLTLSQPINSRKIRIKKCPRCKRIRCQCSQEDSEQQVSDTYDGVGLKTKLW